MKPANGQQVRDEKTAIWEPSMRFGLVALPAKDGLHGAKPKRLTFEEAGETNNTCVRLDGKEWLFGETPYRFLDGPPSNIKEKPCLGRWQERDVRLGTTATGRQREGRKSVWIFDDQKILVTQTVEIVPGAQSSLLDTCLVRYDLENKDGVAHEVGLRFLLDTFIGDNDGVPFLLPGADQLCSTKMEFQKATDVPDFIQAYENNDLKSPGTVAHVGLKVPGLDPPDRVTLSAWPNVALGRRDRRCEQQFTRWEVPVLDMNSLSPADSAVTIYWNERTLKPGERRSVGFSYGLGVVAGGEGGGNLAVTIGGSFAPEGEFTVTAYVQDPVPGQTVTLTLPDGFKLLGGDAQQTVPQPPAGAARATSPVTWKVQGPRRKGTYSLKVKSSTGASQTQPVKISVPKTIFGN
jgi:hypothetical protein